MAPCLVEHDCRLHSALRRLPDEHRAWLGHGLDPGSGVDEVARDHALSFGADRDGRFACQNAATSIELSGADFRAQGANGIEQVERRPHGALWVIVARDGSSPNCHHRVPDEFLDATPVALDNGAGRVEVVRKELPYVLGVASLGEGRVADEVGEKDGDEPALRRGSFASFGCRSCTESRTALTAELDRRGVRRATRGARLRKRASALAAELAVPLVRRPA